MTSREDKEISAGEYVLGTLDAEERAEINIQRPSDAELDAAIQKWEKSLAPLLDLVPEAGPRPGLLSDIQQRIEQAENKFQAEVIKLRRQVKHWKTASLGAAAIAASVLAFVFLSPVFQIQSGQEFVGVFQEEDKLPRFIISMNLEKRALTVKPVAAKLPAGKTYQLWIKHDAIGPSPKSLGLLRGDSVTTHKELTEFESAMLKTATFGISIEDDGGSVSGKPAAGALHSKLIPAAF